MFSNTVFNLFAGSNAFANNCHVLVEGITVATRVAFPVTVQTMFASYYVLNMAYPEETATTMEFLQRSVHTLLVDLYVFKGEEFDLSQRTTLALFIHCVSPIISIKLRNTVELLDLSSVIS